MNITLRQLSSYIYILKGVRRFYYLLLRGYDMVRPTLFSFIYIMEYFTEKRVEKIRILLYYSN